MTIRFTTTRRLRSVLLVALACGGILSATTAAAAQPDGIAPDPGPIVSLGDLTLEHSDATDLSTRSGEARGYSYKLIGVTKQENVAGATEAGRCLVLTDGGSCSITSGNSVSVSVGTSLGLSAQGVSAGLNASYQKTVTLSIGCSSPALTGGQSWIAHPVGTAFTCKIQRSSWFGGSTTSQELTAFFPRKDAIACGVQ